MSTDSHPRRSTRRRTQQAEESELVAEPVETTTTDDQVASDAPESVPANLAHPLRRAYAFLIDAGLILAVVYMVAPFAGGRLFSATSAVVDVFVFFGYFVFTTGIFGRTLGKWVAGIKVVDSDGKSPGVAVAIPREMAGKFVAAVVLGIGLIWIMYDSRRQGWHDKIAGTYVVNHGEAGPSFLSRFFYPDQSKENGNAASQKPNDRVGNRSSGPRKRRRKAGRFRR